MTMLRRVVRQVDARLIAIGAVVAALFLRSARELPGAESGTVDPNHLQSALAHLRSASPETQVKLSNLFKAIFEGIALIEPIVPQVVNGIEAIHGDAVAGADKKKLAQESLLLATTTAAGLPATILSPENAVLANLVGALVGQVIQKGFDDSKANGSLAASTASSYNLPLDATVEDLTTATANKAKTAAMPASAGLAAAALAAGHSTV